MFDVHSAGRWHVPNSRWRSFRCCLLPGWAVDAQRYEISTYAGGAPASATAAISMAADPSGNLYFVDGYGYTSSPARSNSVFKIDPSGLITRFAGNSRTGFSGDGAQAVNASLTVPRAVAADRAGNVFIVDAGNQRVRRVSPDGIITTVAGGGSAVLGDGGPATKGQLNYPQSIAIDSQGNLFVGESAASGRSRLTEPLPPSPVAARTIRVTAVPQPALDSPPSFVWQSMAPAIFFLPTRATMRRPTTYGYSFRKVSPDGLISTLPPIPFCCYGDMTADAAGNLFVAAGPNVWKIAPNGARTVVAGNGNYGAPSGDGQLASRAQLNGPTAVTVNAAGDLLIADNVGRNVRKVTADGIIRAVASIPGLPPVVSGDGGPAIGAQLQLAVPGTECSSGLAVDSAGNLYIAETGAHRVRKVSPSGTITTVAGTGAPRCSGPSTVFLWATEALPSARLCPSRQVWRSTAQATCSSRIPPTSACAKFPRTESSPPWPAMGVRRHGHVR